MRWSGNHKTGNETVKKDRKESKREKSDLWKILLEMLIYETLHPNGLRGEKG